MRTMFCDITTAIAQPLVVRATNQNRTVLRLIRLFRGTNLYCGREGLQANGTPPAGNGVCVRHIFQTMKTIAAKQPRATGYLRYSCTILGITVCQMATPM